MARTSSPSLHSPSPLASACFVSMLLPHLYILEAYVLMLREEKTRKLLWSFFGSDGRAERLTGFFLFSVFDSTRSSSKKFHNSSSTKTHPARGAPSLHAPGLLLRRRPARRGRSALAVRQGLEVGRGHGRRPGRGNRAKAMRLVAIVARALARGRIRAVARASRERGMGLPL